MCVGVDGCGWVCVCDRERKLTDVFSRLLFVFPLQNNEKTMTGKTPSHLFLLEGSQPKKCLDL